MAPEPPSVDRLDVDTERGERILEARRERVPRQRRGPVDGENTGRLAPELGRQWCESALDRDPDDRVGRGWVVAHAGGRARRSIVNAALHEKSRAPSGSPVVGS